MRMRFKPYARPELAAWPHNINNPEEQKGQWGKAFANGSLPLRLELGCGKGGFLAQLALRDTTCNHVGIDIKSEVLVVAKRNIEQMFQQAGQPIANVAITSRDIEKLDGILAPEDNINRIYINFCNPWYKSGHAKHRLTHPRQLLTYRKLLQPGGEIWFKTDDDLLFNDSLRYFHIAGFEQVWITRDLHANEPDWNIRTEHENMFSAQGIAIKACICKMLPVNLDEDSISKLRNV